jgi:hypothetical protein
MDVHRGANPDVKRTQTQAIELANGFPARPRTLLDCSRLKFATVERDC